LRVRVKNYFRQCWFLDHQSRLTNNPAKRSAPLLRHYWWNL
jgi:hypothetical protein